MHNLEPLSPNLLGADVAEEDAEACTVYTLLIKEEQGRQRGRLEAKSGPKTGLVQDLPQAIFYPTCGPVSSQL